MMNYMYLMGAGEVPSLPREATRKDIPALLVLGKKFCSQLPMGFGYDENSLMNCFNTMIDDSNSVIFISEDLSGMIGGMVYPYWINTSILTGNESFWFVDSPGDGLALWTKLEKWAKNKGVSFFQMMRLANSEPRLQKIYERKGYIPLEHTHAKVF